MCDLLLTTTTLINKTFFYSVLFFKTPPFVSDCTKEWTRREKEVQKKKKHVRVWSVELSRQWQGRAEPRPGGGQWEWSKAARHHISHLNHSLHHTTRHCFSDWDMQGHQKLQRDHWTFRSGAVRPAERGCPLALEEVTGGASSFRLACWEEGTTSVLWSLTGFCGNKQLQTSSSLHMQVTRAQFSDLKLMKWSLKSADELTWRKG